MKAVASANLLRMYANVSLNPQMSLVCSTEMVGFCQLDQGLVESISKPFEILDAQ